MNQLELRAIDPDRDTIGELALGSPGIIPLLERWEIDFCCRGHRSIREACVAAGVSTEELFAAIATPGDNVFVDWYRQSLRELQSFLVATHHAYTRQAIETISLLSAKVSARHGGNHTEVLDVEALFATLAAELGPHLAKEENILFPYVAELEERSTERGRPSSCFGSVANPIRMMLMEHDSAGELLVRLRRATRGYALPQDACLSYRALYERLEDFESDLHRHIHLENNVLFPRALSLESYR